MNTMCKKGISIILVMVMVLGGLNGLFAGGGKANAAVSFAGGTGSSDDPYQIATASQLDEIRLGLGLHYKLIADIDLTAYLSEGGAGYNSGAGWVPIGEYYDRFLGKFDGNGFKVMNLKITQPEGDLIGFFGVTNGTITNLILENVNVGAISRVGAIAGENNGTISNSSVTGSLYTDPANIGINKGNNIGGLVGVNSGTINSSYSAVNVSGVVVVNANSGYSIGGLVGFNNQGRINDSYATGNVSGNIEVGGLAGGNSQGIITNSYAIGSVTGNDSVGGLVGGNNYNGSVNNSFYDSSTTGQSDTGKGVGKLTAEMKDQNTFANWDFSSYWYIAPDQYPQLWTATLTQGTSPGTTKMNNVATGMEYSLDGVNYTAITGASIDNIAVIAGDTISIRVTGTSPLIPKTLMASQTNIRSVEFAGGNGEEATPYLIATVAQLSEVRNHLEPGIYFKLTADIDLSGHANWVPLGDYNNNVSFYGNFDGNGFRIINLNLNSESDYGGLFGYAESVSIIRNLILENISVYANESTGGLVGRNQGTISNSSVSGTVYGSYSVGGLVGVNEYSGTIINSHASVSVNGENKVGGLVGNNYEGTISTSYATGRSVSESNAVGGLVGNDELGTISNSFYDSETTEQSDTGKGVGKSTAEMQTISTFTDWNFSTDWYMLSDQYPQLWAFTALTPGTNNGTTKLNNVASGMEYSTDGDIYTAITGTSADNIYVNVGDTISVRVAATPLSAKILTVDLTNSKPVVVIATAVIAAVTAPVMGATPVTVVTETMDYTGTVVWSSSPVTFAANKAYTATITITPKAGYTLTGVAANFFTVAGATTTNDADSGVVTAVFPATAAVLSSNALLSNLDVDQGTLTPAFSSLVSNYTVDVSNSVSSLNINLTKAEPTETLTVTGAVYTSAMGSVYSYTASNLSVGLNLIQIVVTAEDGTINPPYNLTVNRTQAPSSNADLSGLTLSSGTLSPVFDASTTAYSASVANNVASLTLTANMADSNATVTINGTAVTSGQASGAINLNVGSNTITVVVTAQNDITKTYMITVTRSEGGSTTQPTTPTTPSTNDTVISTDGHLTLPAGSSGEVSLGDEVTVSIPGDATNKDLEITVEEVENTQDLVTNNEVLVSPVYEILKNFSENFTKPVTLTFLFNLAIVNSNQRVAVFYYDEVKKIWVEIGGKVTVNQITVEVDHFTKFAVMAVDKETDTPVKDPSPATNPLVKFTDISGHWAEANINQAVSNGIVKGYLDGTFKPNHTVTRAEFAVMLMNVLKPQEEGSELTFTDSAKIGTWARRAVAQAVQADIINGYEDRTFRPNAVITRAEMAAMIAKALDQSKETDATTSFADDKDIPTWARSSVAYMKQVSIMQGKGDNKFAPQDHATRAEAITVLLNMMKQMSN